MYEYRVLTCRVIDGDTVEATLDLGFHTSVVQRIRLDAISAPESNTPEGEESTKFLTALIQGAAVVTCKTRQEVTKPQEAHDRYYRYFGTLYDGDNSLNQHMVDSGYATAYTG